MAEVLDTVSQLSWMRRNLGSVTLEALRNDKGGYVERLKDVADRSFMYGQRLGGTTTASPSVLAFGPRSRVREQVLKGHAMFHREMPTSEGRLVMFPLKVVALSQDSIPIIDPNALNDSYSIVHAPNDSRGFSRYSPAQTRIDMAFSVDNDNLVTVNGASRATVQEHILFDQLVNEFESRVADISDADMAFARQAAGYR